MTREEVVETLQNMETEYGFNTHDVEFVIAGIFNDFESRTCITCKRLVENYKGFKLGCDRLDFIVSENWFCADWEAKDDK